MAVSRVGVEQASGPAGPVGPAGTTDYTALANKPINLALIKIPGALLVGAGTTRLYNDTGRTWVLLSIRATVETAPSGGTVVVDVNKNGTTVFTTQANRPTVASGAVTSGKVTNMNITSVADGDYVTVDVDSTTAPAADLTVLLAIQ